MDYFKTTNGNYILSVGTGAGGEEITETEYNEIMSAIQNKPQATETTDYQLKTDLTWEPYEIEPIEEPDIEDAEALDILLGGVE